MCCAPRRERLALCVMVLLLVGSAGAQNSSRASNTESKHVRNAARFSSNPNVKVSVVNPSGLPLRLSDVAVETDFGRGISRVLFTVQAENSVVRSFSVLAVIRSIDGLIKGGESWIIGSDCAGTSDKLNGRYSQVLRHDLWAQDEVVISASEVITPTNRYRYDWNGDADSNPTASISVLAGARDHICGPDCCDWCVERAQLLCGSRGVKSFNCGIGSTCTCSLTCN